MKSIYLFILISANCLFSQQIKSWQNYTNLREISDLEIKNEKIWASTEGGVFQYSIADDSYLILTKSEGISSHTITSIAIDNSEKVWLGTSEGYIDVYDPSTNGVSTILQIFKSDRSNKRINDIQISGDTAYISTAFGLSLVNTQDLSFFDSILKFGDFTTETPVFGVLLDDFIYVITQAGLAINNRGNSNLIAPEAWSNKSLGGDIPASRINDLLRFNGQLYAATDEGLIVESGNLWQIFLYNNFEVYDLFTTENKLYSVLINTIRSYDQSNELIIGMPGSNFKRVSISGNNLFIASSEGIISYDGIDTTFIVPNSPETNAIIDISVDSESNVWIGTGRDNQGIGVLKFDGENWETLNKDNVEIFPFNDFHRVSAFENTVFLSSWGKGFIKYSEDEYTIYNNGNTGMIGIPDDNNFLVINDVMEDDNGNIWILNYWAADRKPLSVLKSDGSLISYEFSSPLSSQIVTVDRMIIDQFGTKWFSGDRNASAPTEGLFYFNENGTLENISDDTWGKLTISTGLRENFVTAMAIDNFGELILGSSEGVDVIADPSNPNSIRGDQYFALRQQTINSIAVDPINQKWFGTEKGIFLTNSDGSLLIENFTKSNSPLPSDKIKSLSIDENNGIVYVGTDFGLTTISTLFIKPNEDFSDLFVYPNPIKLSSSIETNIVIEGLIEDSEIKILDISGNLINEFRSVGGKTTTWNCRNFSGNLISSGIYIVVAFDSEENETGVAKFAVLRN